MAGNASWTDIISTTLENRSKQAADNVTLNNGLLYVLDKKGNVKPCPGGRTIVQNLLFSENANGGFYSGYEPLPTSPSESVTAAEFAWKQYACPVVMSGLEEMQNSGEDAVLDLMGERIKGAEATMANAISVSLYGDGTGSGGRAITGLAAAVPVTATSGTYGGINVATTGNEWWRSTSVAAGTAAAAATIQGFMNTTWASVARGKNTTNLIVADVITWSAYMASLQANQRFVDADMASAGFKNVEFFGIPVILDGGIGGGATTKTMYFLNTDFIHYRPHSKRNMKPIGKSRVATNQDATVEIIGWMGNMTTSVRRLQGRLTFT